MKQCFAWVSVATLLAGSMVLPSQSQEKPPTFSAAEVHTVDASELLGMAGPFAGSGLYRLRHATAVELIALAYGVDANKVAGGPSWLGLTRFDITAKIPTGTTAATLKVMLQTLLKDQFKLVVHDGESPVQVYALRAGNKPLLKPSNGSEESGCKTQPLPGSFQLTNGAVSYMCRNLTMDKFADTVRSLVGTNTLNGNQVVDQTNLKGSWNFDITFRRSAAAVPAGEERLYFFDALPRQLGLEISFARVPQPALIVDSARVPTANPGNLAEIMSALPTTFEVATIKPSPPGTTAYRTQIQPGGRVLFQGAPLYDLVRQAWDLPNREMVLGPKFLDSERFEIVAKIPDLEPIEGSGTPKGQDTDLLNSMLRSLLIERFKMVSHQEDRPVTAYTLRSLKPKLRKADPANRTACSRGAGGGDTAGLGANPVNTMQFNCLNITMAQFAKFLEQSPFAGLARNLVLDSTGIDGAWDFTLAFSSLSEVNGTVGGIRATGGDNVASTPTGRLTLFEAMETQLGLKLETTKRPRPVLVIDRMEQRPTEN